MKVCRSKIEYLCKRERQSERERLQGVEIKKVEDLKYSGSESSATENVEKSRASGGKC